MKKLSNGQRTSINLKKYHVMGIINVTPDSFYADSRCTDVNKILTTVATMIADGASIIDVGGESTRPGATPISTTEELERVIPAVEAISKNFDITISVDTSNPVVMKDSISAGAGFINDVRSFNTVEPDILKLIAAQDIPVCIMHMQGCPKTMQKKPEYVNVVEEVLGFFEETVIKLESFGVKKENIVLDPGFGFGKTLTHNLQMLKNINVFKKFGQPILVGISRKSMLEKITAKSTAQRLNASIAAHTIALHNGVNIIRTHDVGATVDALKVSLAVAQA